MFVTIKEEINDSMIGKTGNNKILPLESLRGIAAICVALFHFNSGSPLTNNPFIRHSYLMVDFFFVLSGYVIALNYRDKISTFSHFLEFLKRRFWRLYPLHIFTLLIFLGIEISKFLFEKLTGVISSPPPFSTNNLTAFIHNIFLTQSFLPENSFNYPSWSISTEFYTYLIFGTILLLAKNGTGLISVIIIGISWLVLHKFTLNLNGIHIGLSIFRCFISFFTGVIMFRISGLSSSIKIETPAVIFATLFLFVSITFMGKTPLEEFVPFIFGLMIYSLIKVHPSSISYRLLSHKALVYLGTISYSIYMVHAAVWWGFRQISRFVLKLPNYTSEDGGVVISFSILNGTIATILGLGMILLISHLTYKHIETPFRRGIDK
jgi:peptidoglycan/LPS O-acetylase OafA/YrhL